MTAEAAMKGANGLTTCRDVTRRVRYPIQEPFHDPGGERAEASKRRPRCQLRLNIEHDSTYGGVESSSPEKDILQHVFLFVRKGIGLDGLARWKRDSLWKGNGLSGSNRELAPSDLGMSFTRMFSP